MTESLQHLASCYCGTKTEALPVDVAHYNAGLEGYVIQHTCSGCRATILEPITGTTQEVLIQVLAANNLMTHGNDEFRRRMLASEAVLRLFQTMESEIHEQYTNRAG